MVEDLVMYFSMSARSLESIQAVSGTGIMYYYHRSCRSLTNLHLAARFQPLLLPTQDQLAMTAARFPRSPARRKPLVTCTSERLTIIAQQTDHTPRARPRAARSSTRRKRGAKEATDAIFFLLLLLSTKRQFQPYSLYHHHQGYFTMLEAGTLARSTTRPPPFGF